MRITPVNISFTKIIKFRLSLQNKPKDEDGFLLMNAIDNSYKREITEYNSTTKQLFHNCLKELFGDYLSVKTKGRGYILTDEDMKKAKKVEEKAKANIIDFEAELEKRHTLPPMDEDIANNKTARGFLEECNEEENEKRKEELEKISQEEIAKNTEIINEILKKKLPQTIELIMDTQGRMIGFNYFSEKGTLIKSEMFNK